MVPWAIDHVLTVIILLPGSLGFCLVAIDALIASLRPGWSLPERVWWSLTFLLSLGVFALTLLEVVWVFDPEVFGPQLIEFVPWVPSAGLNWFVGVDGLSLVLIVLTTGLVPLVLVVTRRQITESQKSFLFCILMVEMGLLGAFLALDAALLFLAWQLILLPTFLMVGRWGGAERIRAARRLGLAWGLGSMLFLWALLVVTAGGTLSLYAPPGSDVVGLLEGGRDAGIVMSQVWVFLAFLISFGLTIPIFPMHAWWSEIDRETPMPLTLFLNAVGLKVGTYFLMRLVLPLCVDVIEGFQATLLVMTALGMAYALMQASIQNDFRRFVSWWTMGQLAFITLGVFSMDDRGLSGAMMTMLSHGLTCAALLLLFGALFERRETSDLSELGGLARPMPVFSSFLAITILSAIGLPPLVGFVGELMMLIGISSRHLGVASLTFFAWVLGAGAAIRFYRRVAWGPLERPENRGLIDLRLGERFVLLWVLIPMVILGVYPAPVLRRVEPTALEILRLIDERLEPNREAVVIELRDEDSSVLEPRL